MGFVLDQTGRHKRAAACYGRAAAIDPSSVFAVMCAGSCLAHAGLHADAVAEFDRAIGMAPGMSFARHMRGDSLHELGRHAEAEASYDAAAAADPGNPFLWAARAINCAAAGMVAKGRDSLAKARALARAGSQPDVDGLRPMFGDATGGEPGDKLAAFISGLYSAGEVDKAVAAAAAAVAAAEGGGAGG